MGMPMCCALNRAEDFLVRNEPMSSSQQAPLAENTILLEVATLIAERVSVGDVFAAFAGRIVGVAAFDFGSLLVYDPDSDIYRAASTYPADILPVDAPRRYTSADIDIERLKQFPDGVEYTPAAATTIAAAALARRGIRRAWAIPLSDGADVVGVMTVARLAPDPFTGEEQHFLRRAAGLLASAVRDEVRVRITRQEARRSSLLTEFALLLNAGHPVESLFAQFQKVLQQAVPSHLTLLTRFPEHGQLEVIGACGVAHPDRLVRRLAAERSDAAHRSTGTLTTELLDGDSTPTTWVADLSMAHVAVSPLRRGEDQLGMLVLGRSFRPFNEHEREYLDVVATLLGQALAVQREREGARRELQEQRALARMVAAAARETDPIRLTDAFAAHLQELVATPVVSFGFLLPDGNVEFELSEGRRAVLGLVAADEADDDGQWVAGETPAGDVHSDLKEWLHVESLVVSAAQIGGATLGYLVVGSQERGNAYTPSFLSLCSLLAQMIGPILQQARLAREANRERALLRLVIDSLSDGVVLLDRDGRVAYQNALGSLFGGVSDLGLSADEPLPGSLPSPAIELEAQLQLAVRSGAPERGRTLARVGDEDRWLDYRLIPLGDPGYRLLCMVHDATEQVELESQREQHRDEMERAARLAALGALVGGVAHELNNPLTAILGFSELLIDALPAGSAQDDLRVINREAQRARNIVQDLLFIARAAPLERRPFTIDTVLGHIERIRRSTWLRDNIRTRVDLGVRTSPIWGNEDRITQVLLNLITNAEDAVRGTPEPTLSVYYHEDEMVAVVEVWDNGTGMDAPTQRRIFEPFFTTKQGTGTGLGLSVSYSIVLAHDGQLEVESTPGLGSCFRMTLPLESAARAEAPVLRVVQEGEGRRLRVLVVDDEPSLRRVCQRMIQSFGHECSVADGPETAMALANSDDFDLVLCDYRLAASTADAVLRRFQEVRPLLIGRTVIATGAASDAGVQELVRRHGLRILPKPYGADELGELLSQVAAA